jgi:SAM-dependent methyltransferase
VPAPPPEYRFYGELAAWWPLISPPGDYAEEAVFARGLLASGTIPAAQVLELGSGGGHNAVHLKAAFTMTLVDLSEQMLEVSRRLNPECAHVRGDMRTIRLERQFDAVFVHDAVDYMTDEADLSRTMATAFAHCRPGGVAVFVPDHVADDFEEDSGHGGGDAADGRGVRYLEWTWDPDSSDSRIRTDYAFVLRDAGGAVRVVHESHVTGLFSRARWLALLGAAGFVPEPVPEVTGEDRPPRTFFVGRRPAGRPDLPGSVTSAGGSGRAG